MEKEKKCGRMDLLMREIIRKVKRREMENLHGLTIPHTRDNSKTA